ncbi:hypothetical protein [Niallia sp. NCCP-28]|uniref:hypothetical protein n=1 Tax=Niallia sp. NCCP-28 TaxID=2934712 RepID=UPI0020804FBB|nr:hypothetical protein [Niallia sp. NCCP-28]GKU82577.1 hypothetical protein NCCP28_19730 [Niallia sp. NCCP-28]
MLETKEEMTVEAKLENHEERITQLENDTRALREKTNEQLNDVKEKVLTGMIRSSDENKQLREDNREMMAKLIGINDKVQERKHELKVLNKQNFWKLAFAIGGSSSAIFAIIQMLVNYFTKQG